jgi:predicted transcriptional regulator
MSHGVSVTIPEHLYRKAKEMARARRRSLDDIIVEALEQGLLPPPGLFAGDLDEEESAVRREMAAFVAQFPSLQAQYGGQHVAILDGRVVDHDPDGEALYRRIASRYPDRFVWLSPVDNEPLPTFHTRSPRLVDSA